MLDPKIYREMGLNDGEYAQILDTLGREPSITEIGMYAVMWSEHCGYKYSRPVLRLFSKYKEAQDTGAVENAGVIDIGGNIGVVMKMESHNHPSAVEPFQGAATGVGGILRDIFTMGARPIAGLNSLRFGPIDAEHGDAHTRYLFEHVVGGISHYGNCLAADETFIWRDGLGVHFDTIGQFVEAHLPHAQDTADLDPDLGVETLSLDTGTWQSCWRPVRRVFRRQAKELVHIQTHVGNLSATPDHPMLIIEPDWDKPSGDWEGDTRWSGTGIKQHIRPAGSLCPGDLLPFFRDLAGETAGESAPLEDDHLPFFGPVAGTKILSAEAISVEECSVYDVEVDGTHLFATTSGIVTHNCVGVPTVGGEITFHHSYTGNPLVNAMAVGVVPMDRIASAGARGAGNPVLYVGSATGRDGIHGATFASVELGPDSESKRPNVQMGDPFAEKLLIEATLEALATGAVVGIQDMGAAGLTCATCEMSAKGGVGMDVDVRAVPQREAGMTPYEIMLSESQERMLAVIERGREDEVAGVFHKWGLNAVVIGHVTDTGRVVLKDGGTVVADVPAQSLADDCPTYTLAASEPAYIQEVQSADLSHLPEPGDYNAVLLRLLASPTIASKRWVYDQYDSMVQTQTTVLPGAADAAVLRLRDSGGKGLALTTDCNPRYCYLDPYEGARLAVAEAARNLSCVGATPLAVTDCLNFASPEKPEGFWQFRRAVEGLADACEALGTPVISGNVSFYNETPARAIFPTPTVGMVGLLPEADKRVTMGFKNAGDLIYLIGDGKPTLGGSEYLVVIHGQEVGRPPALDMEAEKKLQAFLREAIDQRLLQSAHDVSDGGLAVCLAECCIAGGVGAYVHLGAPERADLLLFGERTATTFVSAAPGKVEVINAVAAGHGLTAQQVGTVGGDTLEFETAHVNVRGGLAAMRNAYEGAIPSAMGA